MIKPVGLIFEISNSNTIQGTCGKCGRPLSPGPSLGFGKRGLLEKGSFQKRPFSRDFREFRDSRLFREPSDWGKQRRFRPFSRDSRDFRDFRDSRDFSKERTPFVMTPFSGPDSHPTKQGSHETPWSKTHGKCGHENAENAADWL